jgi:hypothetical protein
MLTWPERLWWLLLLPVLWLLAQPPRPRRQLVTAHLAQWLAAQAALRRRPVRFRALRFLLLALAFALCALAHAGPRGAGRDGPLKLAVLLDASASMGARGPDGRSAYEQAADAVRRELADVPPHVEVTLLRCGGEGGRLLGAAARALGDPGPPGGDLPAPFAELAAMPALRGCALLTVTDGQHGVPDTGALRVVGRPLANASLRLLRRVDRWPLPALDLELAVASHADTAMAGELRVDGAVAPMPPQPVDLPAGGELSIPLALQRTAPGGPLSIELALAGDGQPGDDVIRLALPPLPAPRITILCEGEPSPVLRAAAASLAGEVGGTVVQSGSADGVGFLLVEGGQADVAAGDPRVVAFGCRPLREEPGAVEVWARPQVVDWVRTEPILEGLDFSELRVEHALRGSLPPGRPLLLGDVPGQAPEPLAVLRTAGSGAALHFAFRLQDSNLGLLPAFPQLMRRGFVAAHGVAAALRLSTPEPSLREADLRGTGTVASRPLPGFGAQGGDLAPWFVVAALLCLLLRAYIR